MTTIQTTKEIQTLPTEAILDLLDHGRELLANEMANRGLDGEGAWVGFEKARDLWRHVR